MTDFAQANSSQKLPARASLFHSFQYVELFTYYGESNKSPLRADVFAGLMPFQVFQAIRKDVTELVGRHNGVLWNNVFARTPDLRQYGLLLDLETVFGPGEILSRNLIVSDLKIQLDLLVADVFKERPYLRAIVVGLARMAARRTGEERQEYRACGRARCQ